MASSPKFSRVDDSTLKHGDEDSDLHDVVEAVLPLCAHWYDLGLALRINPSSLDTIKATESDPKKRLNTLMSKWLSKEYNFNKYGNPSWKLLCAAVHSPVGGNNPALAEKIANNHLAVAAVTRASGSSTTTTSSTPGPSGSSTTTPGSSQKNVEHDALDSKVELKLIYNLPISDLDGVGLELGISPNTLRVIQKNNSSDVTARKRETLSQWLRQDIKASYRKLAEVLYRHDPREMDSIEKLAKNLGCSVDALIPPDQPVAAPPPTVSIGYGHLLDPEDSSDLLATIRSAASQWRDIGCHLGFKHKELNNMTPKNNTPVDYLEEMLEQWLNWAPPLRSFAYTEDLVEALRAAKLEKLAHTLENDERFMKKENYKQIERATPSTGTSKSGEYSKSYSSIPHHSDRKSADSGPVNKKQTEGVPDDNSDRIDLHDSHSGIRMDSTLAHGAATREHTDGNGSGSTAAQWTKIPDGNRPKAVPQQTYRENPEEKQSKDGYVKHKRGNLTSSEHSNSNEQVQGVRQQIDSHPPPLPPVEEEMHTKPSQHAHVHTEEDLEMPLVLLMDQVPRPLDSDDNLLDQEAMVAVNVAVGGEQASMDEAMIEGVQGQDQMVEQCGDVTVIEEGTSPSHLVMSKGQEEGRDTFSSERSGGDTAQSEVSDNAVPKGVLGRPAHETKCDVGGSHGGKTNSEKAPNRTDAVAAFQKSQDEKPNNKMDSTMLSPGASKGKEVIRDAFSSERSGGNTSQSEVIDNVKWSREGILEGPSHETKCDDGGSHVGTSKPKKTPNSSDAMDLFQQSQEEKPSNKMKGTVLSPGTQGEEPVVAEPYNIEKCSTGTSPQSAQGKNPKKGNGRVKIDGQEDEVTFKSGSEEGGAVASSKNPANKIENGTQSSTVSNGASKSGEYSKSDPSIPDALHNNRKSADNGPENKKQTEVVSNEDSNGTDLHDNHSQMEEEHSPSVSSAGVSEESVVANGADTREHTDGNRSNTFPQQTHKENPGKKKSKGTSTSKGCSKPPDQSVHSSDGTAAQNGSDNKKQPNFTQIQVNNIQITHPTVSQPERREVPAPEYLQLDITDEGITDSFIDQVAAEVPKESVAEIFTIVYAMLSGALEPDVITPALFSIALISTVERDEIIAVQGQTPHKKTSILLRAVQRAINAEPNNFYTFLKLLNKNRDNKCLVKKIMDCVNAFTRASGSSTTTTSSTPGTSGSSITTTSSTPGSSGSSTITTSSTPGPSDSSNTTPGSSQNEVENDGATDVPTSNADSSGLPSSENDDTSETSNQISSRITVIRSFISLCPVWLKTSLKMAVLLGILYIGILKLYRLSLRWKKTALFLLPSRNH